MNSPRVHKFPENRMKDWPVICQREWCKTLLRWEQTGENKTVSNRLISALRHALECNLLYIEYLEEQLSGTKVKKDWLQYNDLQSHGRHGLISISKKAAIKYQREVTRQTHSIEYESDQQALDDFIVVNWAWEIPTPHWVNDDGK